MFFSMYCGRVRLLAASVTLAVRSLWNTAGRWEMERCSESYLRTREFFFFGRSSKKGHDYTTAGRRVTERKKGTECETLELDGGMVGQRKGELLMSWSRADRGVSAAVKSKSSPCGPKLKRDRISFAFWTQLIGCRQEHQCSHQSGGSSGSFPLICILSDPSHLMRFKTRGRLSADSREFHPSSLNLPHELQTSAQTPLSLFTTEHFVKNSLK